MLCLSCEKKFNTSSCGLIGWEYNYCSKSCWIKSGSPEYDENGVAEHDKIPCLTCKSGFNPNLAIERWEEKYCSEDCFLKDQNNV